MRACELATPAESLQNCPGWCLYVFCSPLQPPLRAYSKTQPKVEGLGDQDPSTIALRIVRDRSRGDAPKEQRQMTCREVWEQLVEEVTGQGRSAPAKGSVHRWLKRWVEDGVLVLGGVLMEGPRKNVRIPSYLSPPIPPLSRGV